MIEKTYFYGLCTIEKISAKMLFTVHEQNWTRFLHYNIVGFYKNITVGKKIYAWKNY